MSELDWQTEQLNDLNEARTKIENLASYGITAGDLNLSYQQELELQALMDYICKKYPAVASDYKAWEAMANSVVFAYALGKEQL